MMLSPVLVWMGMVRLESYRSITAFEALGSLAGDWYAQAPELCSKAAIVESAAKDSIRLPISPLGPS